jgi:hypothetical protein
LQQLLYYIYNMITTDNLLGIFFKCNDYCGVANLALDSSPTEIK